MPTDFSSCMPLLSAGFLAEAAKACAPESVHRATRAFAVDRKIIRDAPDPSHVLSMSLFFRTANSEDDFPCIALTERVLKEPEVYGISARFNPWDHYVKPILSYGPFFSKKHPSVRIRIYLAKDMEFLADRLSEFADVFVMANCSERSAPGMLWRWLAAGDHPGMLTVLDADMFGSADIKVRLTESLAGLGTRSWRLPVAEASEKGVFRYRAIAGCFCGLSFQIPEIMRYLVQFVACALEERLPNRAIDPSDLESYPLFGSKWPDYGFDEYFLTLVVYPILVEQGVLSLIFPRKNHYIQSLDLVHCALHNCSSRIEARATPYVTRKRPMLILGAAR